MRSLGVFLWTVVWWVCEPIPIPVTSFMGLAMLVIAGIRPVDQAFVSWADWINIFSARCHGDRACHQCSWTDEA